MKIILPAPRSTIRLPKSRLSTNWELRFTSMTSSQYSSGCSAAGLRRGRPGVGNKNIDDGKVRHHAGGEFVDGLALAKIALIGSKLAARLKHRLFHVAAARFE